MPQFPANIDLSSLNGSTGFKLIGVASTFSGRSVASAGDVNGDGFAEVIVGTSAGASYVVFGQASGFAANINLSSLDGSTGFSLSGAGFSVNSAGDVNGDGFADLIVGDSGVSYVVFGHASGFAANIALASLDGSTGFRLSGAGTAVASAGDVNGDGFADLIVGALGAQYVVFGKASGFAANIDVSALDGITGFTLSGAGGFRGPAAALLARPATSTATASPT
jgi:FG-GAP-like repeat/FG-GAP repeat